MKPARTETTEETLAKSMRTVRVGHGANCSSVGSVIDTLFLSAAVGGAIFAAVAAVLAKEAKEPITILEPPSKNANPESEP